MASTLRLSLGWEILSPSSSTLLMQQISVSIKEIVRLGRDFPWPRPERCPRCGHCRLWGHGFVSAYFDGYWEPLWLRRYRCPACRLILQLKPSGYFKRFQASIETIRQSLSHRFYRHLWPPGTHRQRQGHWLRSLFKQAKVHLGLSGFEDILEAFDRLMSLGINPVSRSV
jgi:hypothetical protein